MSSETKIHKCPKMDFFSRIRTKKMSCSDKIDRVDPEIMQYMCARAHTYTYTHTHTHTHTHTSIRTFSKIMKLKLLIMFLERF